MISMCMMGYDDDSMCMMGYEDDFKVHETI